MEVLIDILLAVLILLASVLCIYLIFTLRALLKSAEAIQKDVSKLVDRVIPVLDNLTEVSNRATRVVNGIEGYWEELDNSIKRIREKLANFTSPKSYQSNENPIKDFIKNLRAFVKGISTFWQTFKKK
ncbi:MAG: hypothetical protein N2249_02130 [Melioribacter sp.]|nr:hypothetical protein [Melioribacter sp.]